MNVPAASRVASLLAAQAGSFAGVHLRARPGAARDAWLAGLRAALPPGTPWLRIPPSAGTEALTGGLDLAATLVAGRPLWVAGLVERASGGFLLLSQAHRAAPELLAVLRQSLDAGRLGAAQACARPDRPLAVSLLVLDEGSPDEQALPAHLLDLLPFQIDDVALDDWLASRDSGGGIATGAPRGEGGALDDAAAAALLCEGACRLGIASLRAPSQALAVARGLAGLRAAASPTAAELAEAAALVYPARVTRLPTDDTDEADPASWSAQDPPAGASDASAPPADPPSADVRGAGESSVAPAPPAQTTEPAAQAPERVAAPLQGPDSQLVGMVLAAMPESVLARLRLDGTGAASGRAEVSRLARRSPSRHGRPVGSLPGDPRKGAPLDLVATLRAALPWQKLRAAMPGRPARLAIRSEDLRVRRLQPRARTTAVFAVDASGSAALHRLNEAKGAVAALLAQCYVRRDQVALLSFRGSGAELLLPPTRSLARVRRELVALPGGGGTPLAAGIAAAAQLAAGLRRRGEAALVVMLTDGHANVARDGSGGRARAAEQAQAEARCLRQSGVPALLVDISPLPQERVRQLAGAMGAEYLPLPTSGARGLAGAVAQRMHGPGRRHD